MMYNEQSRSKTILKRIAISAAVIIAVAGVGIGVAYLFKNLSARFSMTTGTSSGSVQQSTNTPTAPSAASVISDYTSLSSVQTLANGNYKTQQDGSSVSTVTIKGDGQAYVTSVPTKAYALFFATSPSEPNDSQAIINQTTTFMTNHGFTKVDTPVEVVLPQGQSVTTYTYLGAACQLTSSPTSTPEFYTIACADKSDIDKQYASIQSLLALYEKTQPLSPFTRAIASTVTSDNKAMTTISLNVQGSHPILLFAAVNGNWQYLGDIGSGATSNGKYYTLSPEVQTAIHDPKYGSFLTSNLQY